MDRKRDLGNIENLKIITLINIIINIIFNLIIIFDINIKELKNINPIYNVNILGYLLFNIVLTMIAVMIIVENKNWENKYRINAGIVKYGIFQIILLIYCIWAIFIKKDDLFIDSSIKLAISYFPLLVTLIAKDVFNENDRRIAWQKQVGTYKERKAKNFFWRFKIYFGDKNYNINRKDIFEKAFSWLIIRIVVILFIGYPIFKERVIFKELLLHVDFKNDWTYFILGIFMFMISLIATIQIILFIIDFIFNLNTRFIGECKEATFYSKSSESNEYYTYIITDFKNKKEIKINSKFDLYNEGQTVMVTHTVFTKIVLTHS
ncbi:hypothetical protein SAMN02745163_02695 [Clostridium cavendishii DSM 21758]|uniref:Uncharacterized protein n=1 Tax=Clostridium cavendishii DSM 21758 TaxID=1121302 RepID=A0A1M6MMM6_9CLOT|nr:hypothetical protein [Clostridium cavendishii]SHJ84712.1 hypothetical protein SAMN02745163_02695 [Clostridium cavendishii DSM 21758]